MRTSSAAAEGFMSSFVQRIHFIGIGGVGMSGIAEVLLTLGYKVSGSDMKRTELTERLCRAGARIHEGHSGKNIAGAQVVVYSSAVKPENPELLAARRAGVPVVQRALMLAELARLKKTLTVSGSHGKTTTTSMAAMALKAAGADPTVVIGGQVKNLGANARLGSGDYFVAEADESDGSFLFMTPLVAVVTNVDNDHLDHYKSMARLKTAFVRHLERLPFYGTAVMCADDPGVRSILGRIKRPVITYGFSSKSLWSAQGVKTGAQGTTLSVLYKGRVLGRLRLKVPGRHNALNALAALAAGHFLGFNVKKMIRGLEGFRGVGRRLEILGEAAGVTFVDDYGHHPTEVRATLAAARDFFCAPSKRHPKGKRLIVVFQPHRYSRTKLLHHEFGPAFEAADRVHVMDIYPAGEKPLPAVSSSLVLASLKRAGVPSSAFTRSVDLVRDIRPGDVVLTLGAGDVWKIGEDLRRRLGRDCLAAL